MFRCKRSGNTISVTDSVAIAELMKHESYEQVKPIDSDIEVKEDKPMLVNINEELPSPSNNLKLKRGRPPKEERL